MTTGPQRPPHPSIPPLPAAKEIGARVRAARKRLHVTQRNLGEFVGVSNVAICTTESGRTRPSLDLLHRLSVALRTPLTGLLYGGLGEGKNPESEED